MSREGTAAVRASVVFRLAVEKKHPMAEAAAAHMALEGRKSAGKLLLGN